MCHVPMDDPQGKLQTLLSNVLTEPCRHNKTPRYVDDFNGGGGREGGGFELYLKAKSIIKNNGFDLRVWVLNSQKLMQWTDHDEGLPIAEAAAVAEDHTYAKTHHGVKGLNWDITRDTSALHYGWLVKFAKDLPLNKRSVLRVVAKLYDPLGCTSPPISRFV